MNIQNTGLKHYKTQYSKGFNPIPTGMNSDIYFFFVTASFFAVESELVLLAFTAAALSKSDL